ncbi:MAG: hypothetical protein ACE5QW_01750 [Thermoplasmata archaeon]
MNSEYATDDNNLSELIGELVSIGSQILPLEKDTSNTRFGSLRGDFDVGNVSRPHIEMHKGDVLS